MIWRRASLEKASLAPAVLDTSVEVVLLNAAVSAGLENAVALFAFVANAHGAAAVAAAPASAAELDYVAKVVEGIAVAVPELVACVIADAAVVVDEPSVASAAEFPAVSFEPLADLRGPDFD